jgi:hypothetical protein
MSVVEIEGEYNKNGRIKLSRKPTGVRVPARVVVRFVDAEESDAGEEVRKAAVEKMLARMRGGIDFGGPPYPTREEIYGERIKDITDRLDRH